MKKNQLIATGVGGSFLLLGLLLLATLVDVLDSTAVYNWVIAAILVFSGITTLQEASRYKTSVGYGLLATGTIIILVRLDILRGDVVNGLLGAVLLIAGASILARTYQKKS